MNAPLRVARRGLTIGARGTYNRHEHLKIMEAAAEPPSTCTSSSVWTQKAHLAPARFASGPRCAFFVSQMPVRSMRLRTCA